MVISVWLLSRFKELGDIARFLRERDLQEPRYGKGFSATTRRIGRLENSAPWNPIRAFCFVVWDNASQHTTPMLLPFLCDNSHRLMMVNLPTYSPHLNKIEKLWWYMRDKITRNHFYQTFDALCQALTGWLERLPFSRFCSLMGIKPREQPIAA